MPGTENNGFGLTETGFKRMRYPDLLSSMQARARGLFGDINLTRFSPLGLFIHLFAWFFAVLWQLAEKVYYSAFVDTATGISLARCGKYISISPRPAEHATGEALFIGEPGTSIPEGSQISTPDDVWFETTEPAETATGGEGEGTVLVPIRAVEPGPTGNVPADTITELVETIPGIDAVTNPETTRGGRREETDAEFYARYKLSVARGGASTGDSIRAMLLGLEGVRAALVAINNTMEEDVAGRPPKSFECYLLGGDREDIAAAILATGAGGIEPYGQETEIVIDNSGREQTIRFTYVNVKSIHIKITVTPTSQFPLDGDEKIVTALVQYLGGIDADGEEYAGIGIGHDVVFNWIKKTAMGACPGIYDVNIEISENGTTWITTDIEITWNEIAETDYGKIQVIMAGDS
ncbi:MAG: baseplate J/gp47 family protein [Desulfotomaculaceae bacterium]